MDDLILVDLEDNPIGYMEKAEAHRLCRLHRAFSVFIVDGNRMLLQQRNKSKYHSGGLWANACCSHPRRGEELDIAVHRRMQEELGIDCELNEVFQFVYCSKYKEDLYEYEYDHVFIGNYAGDIHFEPEEIETTEWVNITELKKRLLETPWIFSSWFMIAAPKVIAILENRE